MANELVTPQMKEMFEDLIGTYGWFILAGFLAVLLKDAIHKGNVEKLLNGPICHDGFKRLR